LGVIAERMMTALEMAICKAWRAAEADLGITFTSPFVLVTETGRCEYLGLVHGFGAKTGALICFRGPEQKVSHLGGLSSYSVSVLTDSYASYDRNLFMETLNDWQWCGEDVAPPWYTGQPWT
jgi:hypothetical protein